jgi:small GTP-binding protein
MGDAFEFDVFLSHSSKDKEAVRAIAERLRADGLKVWFDEWVLKPGDNIPAKTEQGLEQSRMLVLCMSRNAFGPDWPRLESQTLRFRDPLNKERRFVSLRMDDAYPKDALLQFIYIDWREAYQERAIAELREACGLVSRSSSEGGELRPEEVKCRTLSLGHTHPVRSVALSADGLRVLSGSVDGTVRLWDVESGCCLRVLEGHSNGVFSVAWSGDDHRAVSGSADKTVRLWDVEDGRCLRVLAGFDGTVMSVAWCGDGRRVLCGSDDSAVRLWDVERGECLQVLKGHSGSVWSVTWSNDGRLALSGSTDNTVRLWDVEAGCCLRVLEGHSDHVSGVAWSADGRCALSGSYDKTVRLWDVETGDCLRVFEGHPCRVLGVTWTNRGDRALSGSVEGALRLWDAESGRCLRVFEGLASDFGSMTWSADGQRALCASEDAVRLWHVESDRCVRLFEARTTGTVRSVAWSGDGRRALSGSDDQTVRLWDVESGRCLRVLEGHSARVWSVGWSGDGRRALSGSADQTVRLWDVESGRCLRVLEGHSARVLSVVWSGDGRIARSGAINGVWREWDLTQLVGASESAAEFAARAVVAGPDQVQYTNAKVLLVGDTSSGKTGLAHRLATGKWKPTDGSTVGAWCTQWALSDAVQAANLNREIWLWDFGGQADQRLIHQLFMDRAALILLLFDADKEDVLPGLRDWQAALRRCVAAGTPQLLVAGRVDAGLKASRGKLQEFARENGFDYFETSAKEGTGCDELVRAIKDGISWEQIEKRTSPRTFKVIKDEILKLRDEGQVLHTFKELRGELSRRLTEEERFGDEVLQAVIGLLDGPGAVKELDYGTYVLLQPEWINIYAQAVMRTLRDDPKELGSLPLRSIAEGKLLFQSVGSDGAIVKAKRLPQAQERVVLREMERQLEERGLCFRQGDKLVFPSHCGRDRPAVQEHPSIFVATE